MFWTQISYLKLSFRCLTNFGCVVCTIWQVQYVIFPLNDLTMFLGNTGDQLMQTNILSLQFFYFLFSITILPGKYILVNCVPSFLISLFIVFFPFTSWFSVTFLNIFRHLECLFFYTINICSNFRLVLFFVSIINRKQMTIYILYALFLLKILFPWLFHCAGQQVVETGAF